MSQETIEKTNLSEEEANKRYEELQGKQDLSDDEKLELDGLKKDYNSRWQKRVDTLTWKAKDAEERFGKANEETERLKKELEELKAERNNQPVKAIDEFVEVGGRKYYTDEALQAMVENNEITSAKAYQLQRSRDKAELKEELLSDIKNEEKKISEEKVRKDDIDSVLRDHPQFNKNHPDFNPNDPLYVEVNRLWENGYYVNPRGMSQAVKDAKKMLRMSDTNPDVSDDLGVRRPNSNNSNVKPQEVEFTSEEEDAAERIYRDVVNPKTQRPYTRQEAINKAKEAKRRRLETRRIT